MNNLTEEDVLIVYKGVLYPIKVDDTSYENIKNIIRLINIICNDFKELRQIYFDNDGLLKYSEPYDIIDSIYNLSDINKLIFGVIGDDGKTIIIDNDNNRLKSSIDFKTIYNEAINNGYEHIIINGKKLNINRTNESYNIHEVDSKDVSLSSFKVQSKLHPKFWIDDKINSRVRLKLLDIVDDFIDELSVNWVKPKDIVFTGSLANYNWSRYSDIDMHILYDFSKIYKKEEFVDDYFKAKKENWKQQHDEIKIYGFPVEISIENTNDESVSSGVYSLNKNKWIVEPENFDDVKLNEKYIKKEASKIMTDIDNIESKLKGEEDCHKLEVLGKKLKNIFKKLKKSRQEALERSGEMSSMNIVYKICRRYGYIDKLWDMVNKTYDKVNSIK